MKLPATVSIDLDDLWAYRRSFGLAEGRESLLPLAVPRFVQLMDEAGLVGTAFIVGRDAARPSLQPWLRGLIEAGHEPGNHSWEHATQIEAWPPGRQQGDLQRAHDAIVAATGVAPSGFRGPAFSVSPALLGAVQAMGYRYDSSTFPNRLAGLARRWQERRARELGRELRLPAQAHGAAHRLPLQPYVWKLPAGELVEVPVTTLPGLRLPIHGTYLQHLADRSPLAARGYAAVALRACRAARVAPHLLLHATDFVGSDDAVDAAFLPGMRRPWRDKRALLRALLRRLAEHFAPTPIGRFVDGLPQPALPRRAPEPRRP